MASEEGTVDQQKVADEWAAAMEEQAISEKAIAEKAASQSDQSRALPLDEVRDDGIRSGMQNLDVILDIPVSIAMEVGSTSISIRNLLQLNQGSVIELDRLAGEPLDVLVNGTLIAHGEVVVVNEKFGIRMTDVISPSERIKRLR